MNVPEKFDFPFEPYPIQHDFMKTLYKVLEERKLGIFESPTGTGKSLSIICGAVHWLKDHTNHEREALRERIDDLEAAKQKIASDTTDWLTTQSQEIEITRQINALKIEHNRIQDYDKKIANLKNTITKDHSKKNYLKENANNGMDNIRDEPADIDEDDDIVLDSEMAGTDDGQDDNVEEDITYKPTKIFICSRTHSQLSQFVGEIRKSPFAEKLRVATLASRQSYCINLSVNRLKHNSLINEKCLDKQKQSTKSKTDAEGRIIKKQKNSNCKCPYYKQSSVDQLKNQILTEVMDVEDLVKTGQQLNACPYYASRQGAADAEVVLVPYNTILHKPTREANGIDLKGNVVIIDEAHNLLEAMSQMHSAELSYCQIEEALLQVKCYKQRFSTRFSAPNLLLINQLIFVLTRLLQILENGTKRENDTFTVEDFVLSAKIDNFNMFRLVKFCKDSRLAQKVRCYAMKYPCDKTILDKPAKKGVKDFLASLKNKAEPSIPETPDEKAQFRPTNPLLSIISFMESLTYSYNDGRIFIYDTADKAKARLQFLLLNPSQNFVDVVKEARSVVVAGGTMKPIEEFKQRLFINSGASRERIAEFSCGHVIPPENILPIVMAEGPNHEKLLFNFESRMKMGNNLKLLLEQACRIVKGGVVVFFPSYKYENWIWQQIKSVPFGRAIFREPQESGSVDVVLKSYAEAISKPGSNGALLLSVVGGKLSEGLNFSDDLGRCIIVVGLPYANVMAPDLKEKMNYLDKTESIGTGQKFYEGLCMKAVNQSIGRAVRHKGDYATILLLDERYTRATIRNSLPDWIRTSLKMYNYQDAFLNVKNFFEKRRSQ